MAFSKRAFKASKTTKPSIGGSTQSSLLALAKDIVTDAAFA